MSDEPLPVDDERWEATLEYTTDDDGIWLVYGTQRRCLPFWPTAWDVADEIRKLTP